MEKTHRWQTVAHPDFERGLELIRRCHLSLREDILIHLRVVGVAGVGKSELIRVYRMGYPAQRTDEGPLIPVLVVEIPALPTELTLLTEILRAFGDPNPEKGNRREMQLRVAAYLKSARVELIIIDEVQHFVTSGSRVKYNDCADMLKSLLNQAKLPLVFIGARSSRHLFYTGSQLRSRIPYEHELRGFNWDRPEDRSNFAGVMAAQLPFGSNNDQFLVEADTLKRLWFATDGIVRQMRNLMVGVREQVAEHKTLNLWTLSEAFKSVLWADAPDARNPFHKSFDGHRLCLTGELYEADPIEGDNHETPTSFSARSRARGKRVGLPAQTG